MATQKTTSTKSKDNSAARLPPLTTEKGKVPITDWHRINMAKRVEQPNLWAVTWDTSRRKGVFNTARDTTQSAAHERAKKFLQLGFIVYSIVDPAGNDSMTENAINKQFKPAPSDGESASADRQ